MSSYSGAVRQRPHDNTRSDKAKKDTSIMVHSIKSGMKVCGWSAFLTALMMLLLFISREVYPFGDKVLKYYGDGAQYYSMAAYLQHTFFSNDNMLYSWGAILGDNMTGTWAYYCASPFNILLLFFPDDLMAGYHLVIFVKLVSASVCFAIMLLGIFPRYSTKAIILFAASYPFIGYTTFFSWNPSWLDGVIFLPLVVLGVWRIISNGPPWIYVVSLALTLFANYYIGYMVCIASVLTLVAGLIVAERRPGRQLVKVIGVYVAASVAAASLAAFLLLPTLSSLPEGRAKTLASLIENLSYRSQFTETLSMLYTHPYKDMSWADNSPIIYTGIVQLVLLVAFFLNSDISRLYKAVAGAILLLFALSFAISLLDVIWHGFTTNHQLYYRYSFLASFFIELLAFYSFVHVEGARGKLLLCGVLLILITSAALLTPKENISAGALLIDVIWICATLAILYRYTASNGKQDPRKKLICFVLLGAVTLGNLFQNSWLSLTALGEISRYTDAKNMDQQIADGIDEDGFYRMASTWRYTLCDPMRAGYAGVANYASTSRRDVVDFSGNVGLRTWQNASTSYDGNVPISTDALLGLRNAVVESDNHKTDVYELKEQISDNEFSILENGYALPIIFPGESILQFNDINQNKFEFMNDCWNSISEAGGDVFRRLSDVHINSSDDAGQISVSFTASDSGPVYAFVPMGDISVKTPIPADSRDIFYVGEFEPGESGEFTIEAKGEYDGFDSIALYSEDLQTLADKTATVQKSEIETTKLSSSHLSTHYATETDGFLASTIPYDNGWHVYIDGEEATPYNNMGVFMAFDVPAGEHEIELVYWPPYFRTGLAISITAVAAVIVLVVLQYRNVSKTSASRRKAAAVPSRQHKSGVKKPVHQQ